MGRIFLLHLDGNKYACKYCLTHLVRYEDLISKNFLCKRGKAYLFESVVNVMSGIKEERMMSSGMHTVADIFCTRCGSLVGLRYEAAQERRERYKVGRSTLERFKMLAVDGNIYLGNQEDQVTSSDSDDV